MKIIQLNVWMGRLSSAIIRFIKEQDPDLLCLQEVFKSDAPVAYPEDRMFDIFGLVEETGLFVDNYFSPAVTTEVAGGVAEFGNAIFSKYPLTKKESFFTDGTHVVENITQEQNLDRNPARNAQFVELDIKGKKMVLINQHFHWSKNPLGDEKSVEKMKFVADKARELNDLPLILCGDFNLKYESDAMRVFDGWLENLVLRTGAKTTLSGLKFPQSEVSVACDYILINEKVKAHMVSVPQVYISDHLPVVAELSI